MATVNIHAFSDTIMLGLMQRLGYPIPPWIVRRRVRVARETSADKKNQTILIEGRDVDDASIPFSLFKSIRMNSGDKLISCLNAEPFQFEVSKTHAGPLDIHLEFFGHYNEIPFDLHYASVQDIPKEEEFYLFYNPMIGKWRQTTKEDDFPLWNCFSVSKSFKQYKQELPYDRNCATCPYAFAVGSFGGTLSKDCNWSMMVNSS